MKVQPAPCSHANHTFAHPLCGNQSLLKKIVNVAFNILTLGIPLAIISIYSCLFPRRQAPVQKSGDIAQSAVDSVKNRAPDYSATAREALEFAESQITGELEIEPIQAGWGIGHQPTNGKINQLYTLYWKAFGELEGLLKAHQQDPWKNEEVLHAADKMIQIAFAVSALTLDDLPAFIEALPAEDTGKRYAIALSRQDSYLYRTFFRLPTAYHYIRGGMFWEESEEAFLMPRGSVASGHSDPYYREGTMQNRWRNLYNEFCQRLRKYVSEREMAASDSRFVNWTSEDTEPQLFMEIPDTLPT